MTLSRHDYLRAMGIDTWQLKNTSAAIPDDWDGLRREVAACTACPLHHGRSQTVFGTGNPHARLMVIGEAPGAHEDRQGEPFVGAAGQLLDAMLAAIQLSRRDVFITHLLKCHPPENHAPLPAEIAQCTPFLARQIAHVKPDLLLAVGRIAAHHLLNTQMPLDTLREKTHHYGETRIPVRVTYHPAELLRNPADKVHAFMDLQQVWRLL